MSTEINDKRPVGILAGEGDLPLQLTRFCIDNDIPVCVIQFKGCSYTDFPNIPILKTRIEKVGAIFSFLKKNKTANVVMIGNLRKPSLKTLRPDLKGLKTLSRIAGSFARGDDNLLRSLRNEIENEGYSVKGVDYYLHDLTADAGCLTTACSNIDFHDAIAESLRYGAEDKGQSVLRHHDGTYAYETRDGTTALIQNECKNGSVLVKMVKPNQDPDLDRPTVGLETLKAISECGGAGIVIQANGVLMIDRAGMVAYANGHNLFIEVVVDG